MEDRLLEMKINRNLLYHNIYNALKEQGIEVREESRDRLPPDLAISFRSLLVHFKNGDNIIHKCTILPSATNESGKAYRHRILLGCPECGQMVSYSAMYRHYEGFVCEYKQLKNKEVGDGKRAQR